MPFFEFKIEAISAAPTAHGGSKNEEFQSEDTFLLFVDPHPNATEEESTLQWGKPKVVKFDPSLEEVSVSILKSKTGFYKTNVVLGEIFLPLRGLHFDSVEYYHIKTRRKGEVRGLLQLRITDMNPDFTDKILNKKKKKTAIGISLKKKGEKKEGDGGGGELQPKSARRKFGIAKTMMELGTQARDFIDDAEPQPDFSIANSGSGAVGSSTGLSDRPPHIKPAVWREITLQSKCGGSDSLTFTELGMKKFPLQEDFPFVLFKTVTMIDLSFNSLKTFPTVSYFQNLRDLDLSGNQLSGIGEEIGQLSRLEEINLEGNQIETISPEIQKLGKLRKLLLSNNSLKALPDLSWCPLLEELTFSGNENVTEFTFLSSLKNLMLLEFSACNMRVVPNSLCRCTKLLELDVSNNQLETLPHNIGRLTRLCKLNIMQNKISDLPVSMGLIHGLTDFNIAMNPIKNKAMIDKSKLGTDHLMSWLEMRMDALRSYGDSVFIDELDEDEPQPRASHSFPEPQSEPQSYQGPSTPQQIEEPLLQSRTARKASPPPARIKSPPTARSKSPKSSRVRASSPKSARVRASSPDESIVTSAPISSRPRRERSPKRERSKDEEGVISPTQSRQKKDRSPRRERSKDEEGVISPTQSRQKKDRSPRRERSKSKKGDAKRKKRAKEPEPQKAKLPELAPLDEFSPLEPGQLELCEEEIPSDLEERPSILRQNTIPPPSYTLDDSSDDEPTIEDQPDAHQPIQQQPVQQQPVQQQPIQQQPIQEQPIQQQPIQEQPTQQQPIQQQPIQQQPIQQQPAPQEQLVQQQQPVQQQMLDPQQEAQRAKIQAAVKVGKSTSLEILGILVRIRSILETEADGQRVMGIGKLCGSLRPHVTELKAIVGDVPVVQVPPISDLGRDERVMRLVNALNMTFGEIQSIINACLSMLEKMVNPMQIVSMLKAIRTLKESLVEMI